MYVPKMIAGLGVGLILGVGAVGTSFAAELVHSSAPVGCASVPTGGGQPVGCASRPGNGYGDPNHTHTGAPGQCPPGLAKKQQSAPVGCASRPGNGYGDKNHTHTGPPGQAATSSGPVTSKKPAAPANHGKAANGPKGAAHPSSGTEVSPDVTTTGSSRSHPGNSGAHQNHGKGKG